MRPIRASDLPEGFSERPFHPWALRDPAAENVKRRASGEPLTVGRKWDTVTLQYNRDEGELTISAGPATMTIPADAMLYIFALTAHELDVFAEAALNDEVLAAQSLVVNGINPGEVRKRGTEFLAQLLDKTGSISAI